MNPNPRLRSFRESSPSFFLSHKLSPSHGPSLHQLMHSPRHSPTDKNLSPRLSFKEIKNIGYGRQTLYIKGKPPSIQKLEHEQQNVIFSPRKKQKVKDKEEGAENAHKIENDCLKQTIHILKQHIELLNRKMQEGQKQMGKYENQIRLKDQETKQREKKYQLYKKKSKDFDELEPKLNELEEMQTKLIEENKKQKQKQIIAKSIFQNIGMIVTMEKEKAKNEKKQCLPTLLKIGTLLEAFDF